MDTFAARYCARHGLPAEKFDRAVFLRSLYPHARLIHRLISLVDPDFFEADYHLIDTMGRTVRLREFGSACAVYRHYLVHASLARRLFRLRISVRRLHRVAAQTFDHAERGSRRPALLSPVPRA